MVICRGSEVTPFIVTVTLTSNFVELKVVPELVIFAAFPFGVKTISFCPAVMFQVAAPVPLAVKFTLYMK